jgi:translation elongation factor P/translation initiation factor 5A
MTEKKDYEATQVNQEFVIYEDGSFALFIDADDLEQFRLKWQKYRELINFYVGMVKEEA